MCETMPIYYAHYENKLKNYKKDKYEMKILQNAC